MKNENPVPARPQASNKLVLNKETIRILSEREMMEVQGATCANRHPISTCVTGPATSPGSGC